MSRNTIDRILPQLAEAWCVESRYGRLFVDSTQLRAFLKRVS